MSISLHLCRVNDYFYGTFISFHKSFWNCLNFFTFLQVAKEVFHDFIKFSKIYVCIKTSQIGFNFIKLPIRCMLNLAAILRRKVLQISLGRRSNLKAVETFIKYTAILKQINFSQFISFKVASYSACYLTNGDYICSLLEKLTRKNKVNAAVKNWKCFQFNSNSGSCIVILQNVSMQAPGIFHVFVKKISLHFFMQLVKNSSKLD